MKIKKSPFKIVCVSCAFDEAAAIDFTNAKYGRNAISIAQAGISNDWKMRREHSSRIDTASFDFLPKINI